MKMEEKLQIIPHHHEINCSARNELNKHKSLVLWFTGLSGSGKSTVANQLEQLLFRKGIRTYLLDGDNIRMGLNKGLTFSEEDRNENIRRIAEVAKLFVDAGIVTLSAFVSPLIKNREDVRNIVGDKNFVEIFIDTPLEICEKRDVKGLYQKARRGEISNFTGISAPYEEPTHPDLIIKTENRSIESCAEEILDYLMNVKQIILK